MRFLSQFSMIMALAAAGTMAISVAVPDAQAAKKKEEKAASVKISKEVQPKVAAIQAAMASPTPETARPLVDSLLGETLAPDDQFVAGQLAIQLGGTLKDTKLQERGLNAAIDSGKTGPDRLAQFNFYSGNFAYGDGRWADAERRLQAAFDLGYRENNVAPLLAQTFFKRNMYAQGLAKWDEIMKAVNVAPNRAEESWYRMARDSAVASKDPSLYAIWSAKWAAAYPSSDSWGDAIAASRRTTQSDNIQNLEVLRFMQASNALTNSRDYKEYAEEASRKSLYGEIVAVLEEGQRKGIVAAGDPVIKEYLVPAKAEVAKDRSSLPKSPADVKGSVSGSVMMNFADVWLGYKDYDKAAAFYQAGLAKSGAEIDRGNIGLGTANALAGNYDAANAAFAKVSGTRAPLAKLWETWIKQQVAPPAPAAAPAAPAS